MKTIYLILCLLLPFSVVHGNEEAKKAIEKFLKAQKEDNFSSAELSFDPFFRGYFKYYWALSEGYIKAKENFIFYMSPQECADKVNETKIHLHFKEIASGKDYFYYEVNKLNFNMNSLLDELKNVSDKNKRRELKLKYCKDENQFISEKEKMKFSLIKKDKEWYVIPNKTTFYYMRYSEEKFNPQKDEDVKEYNKRMYDHIRKYLDNEKYNFQVESKKMAKYLIDRYHFVENDLIVEKIGNELKVTLKKDSPAINDVFKKITIHVRSSYKERFFIKELDLTKLKSGESQRFFFNRDNFVYYFNLIPVSRIEVMHPAKANSVIEFLKSSPKKQK